ncbi:MAG: sulfatase-like hydrolase/transferase [Anaerolineae bacterium]
MTQPNLILIECDSMDGRWMGCMNHPAMARATPNLDALAERGVLFRNTYTNNPVCCPSRASMFSGLYTHHCEGWNNYKGLEPGEPTFLTRLDEAGYRTQTFGKTDYLSGHHTIRARVSPWTRSAFIPRNEYRMEGPEIIDGEVKRVHEYDWKTVDRGVSWLEEAATDPETPFTLYLGLNAPHPAFRTSSYWLDKVDEAGITVPPEDQHHHPALAYQRFHKNWLHGFDDDTVLTVRRIYAAMIAETDAMVGAVMDAVDRLDLAATTAIIFISDHGELAMDHRQFYKMSMYEGSVRVPMIVAGPEVSGGRIIDDLVSLIDIYPTLMDMTGTPGPESLEGHSLTPLVQGDQDEGRPDVVLSQFHGSTLPTGTFMLRQGPWKYVAYVGYPPQLFNLEDDPEEIHDLAETRSDVVKELDDRLRQMVDYEAVDARVKAYDRRAFAEWRSAHRAEGTYEQLMARVYSGWDHLTADDIRPWTPEDEALIIDWLKGG